MADRADNARIPHCTAAAIIANQIGSGPNTMTPMTEDVASARPTRRLTWSSPASVDTG